MTTFAPTLYARSFPRSNARLRDFILIFGGAILVALFAQIKILLPFSPVPITGQTFATLLIGATLGSKRGALSMMLYIALGTFGLPVFAGGASGMAYLTGATMGYLVGFVVSAYIIGKMAERGFERNLRTSLLPFLVGTFVIYLFGAGWLATLVGMEKALALGVSPFLVGDLIKLMLAALALPTAWKILR
ncbi:MAG: biotin transporter BioY [Anaerolineae bacterium]|jgi:biotin transport system substrate-specific component|nr:biotin transporter BioY [Anaerolineae bacterium]MBT7073762.1 biotin transporter BioY [Anaerolineae bacterium]MBT7782084.1 biotin transporter BioY [Anaerolineae bacterium]